MSDITTYSNVLEEAGFNVTRAMTVPSGAVNIIVYRFSVEARGGIRSAVEFRLVDDEVQEVTGLPPMYSWDGEKVILTDDLPKEEKLTGKAQPQEPAKAVSESVKSKDYTTAENAVIRAFDLGTAKLLMGGKEKPRRYIGASHIGNPCVAYNTLCARGFPNVLETPKQARIFQDGHRIEDFVVSLLKAGGLKIDEVGKDGKQFEYTALGGHLVCHLDGIVRGEDQDVVLEVKSMNSKRYRSFTSNGVQISDPHYYAQVQMCMFLSGLKYALFVVYCKDNSAFSSEIVPYDQDEAEYLFRRAKEALNARELKRNENFECSFCFKREACLNGKNFPVGKRGCAQCVHAVADETKGEKSWLCELFSKEVKGDQVVCPNFTPFNNVLTNPVAKVKL